jgi:hypothetical protein
MKIKTHIGFLMILITGLLSSVVGLSLWSLFFHRGSPKPIIQNVTVTHPQSGLVTPTPSLSDNTVFVNDNAISDGWNGWVLITNPTQPESNGVLEGEWMSVHGSFRFPRIIRFNKNGRIDCEYDKGIVSHLAGSFWAPDTNALPCLFVGAWGGKSMGRPTPMDPMLFESVSFDKDEASGSGWIMIAAEYTNRNLIYKKSGN